MHRGFIDQPYTAVGRPDRDRGCDRSIGFSERMGHVLVS